MFTSVVVRRVARGVLAAAALLGAPPNSLFAQDNNGGTTAPQSPPPAVTAHRPPGLMGEPGFLVTALDFAGEKMGKDTSGTPKDGFYPELTRTVTGAGWISVGPGYRYYFDKKQILFDASAGLSWHLYKFVQTRLEFQKPFDGRLVFGVQAMWQDDTQVDYYGIGSDTTEDERSQYRFRTQDVVGYARYQPRDSFAFTGEMGWLGRAKVSAPTGTFRGDFPDTQVAFPADPGVSLETQPTLLHAQAAAVSDTRDHPSYPSRGGVYRAATTHYSDRSTGVFSFTEYEGEALQFVPVVSDKWVLALHGWALFSDVPAGHEIPFYLLPSIGGQNSVRSFRSYRFHDNNLLLVNAESRLRLTEHIDWAVFGDAGNVASRFADLNLDKTAVGVGIRLHTDTTTVARMDVAHGSEGWLWVFRTSEPLRLARIARQVALMPFTP